MNKMNNKSFEDNLLKIKKAKFLEIVERTAKSLKVVVPGIVFWEGDCPYYSGKERAHIHPDDLTICISLLELKKMTFDDIEECASHEVTHLTDKRPETEDIHSPDFYRRHEEVKIANWRPPGGIVVIDGSKTSVNKVLPKTKKIIDKIYCNNCGKKVELKKCKYCYKYFCEDCINPYEPWVGHPTTRPIWYKKDDKGHPDPDYYDWIHIKKLPPKEEPQPPPHEPEGGTEVPPEHEEPNLRDFPQLCPSCNTYSVVPIVYGLPGPDLVELAKKGKVKLGGCLVSNPKYWCINCEKNIKKPEGKIPKYIKKQSKRVEDRISINYAYRTTHEAELIYKTAKIRKTNIVEKFRQDDDIIDIELERKLVTFVYKIHKEPKKSKLLSIIMISILVILLILFVWFISTKSNQVDVQITETNDTSNKTTTIYGNVPIKISFSEYLNNKEKYENKLVTLTGFLRYKLEGTDNVGVYVEVIVDDYGNEIRLQNIPKEYRKLFVPKETTKELYNVTGTFRKKYKTAEIEVSKITSTERQMQIEQTN